MSNLYIPFHLTLCEWKLKIKSITPQFCRLRLTSCSFLLLLASLKFALQQLVASFIRSANGRWRIPIRQYFFKDNTISHRCHTWCKCNTKITRKVDDIILLYYYYYFVIIKWCFQKHWNKLRVPSILNSFFWHSFDHT